jgi:hypothetical protein
MVLFRIERRYEALEMPDFNGPPVKTLFRLQDRGLVITPSEIQLR